MLKLHVGFWDGRLTMSPAPEDEPMFKTMGAIAVVAVGRKLLFMADPNGALPCSIDRDRNGGLGVRYTFAMSEATFGRFMLHDMEADVDDNGALVVEVDEDHRLPYPRLNVYSTGDFDRHALALEQLRRRCASAALAGGEELLKSVLRGVPGQYRALIPTASWKSAVDAAIEAMWTTYRTPHGSEDRAVA